MKRRLLLLLALPLLALLLLAVADCSAGETELQEPTAIIDPAVWEALEEQSEVDVFISLRQLDIPRAEQTTQIRKEHTAEVQARVLAILEPGDFEIYHQYAISPALSGMATAAGIEKLSMHPDVIGINLVGGGELH